MLSFQSTRRHHVFSLTSFLLLIIPTYYTIIPINALQTTTSNNNIKEKDDILWVVDLKEVINDKPTELSVYACQGLFNRNPSIEGAVYTLHPNPSHSELDAKWLENAGGDKYTNYHNITVDNFLNKCLSSSSIVKGYIRYNFEEQLVIISNIITMAGILDAIPLNDGTNTTTSLPLVFDAATEWNGYTEYDATEEVFKKYSEETTAMSKMNPGWYAPASPFKPILQKDGTLLSLELTDYIVQTKLFNFFLWFGCVDKSLPHTTAKKEHKLLNYIADNNHWEKPTPVYGYDTSWMLFGGYTFEAETNCASSSNMGAVPTRSTNNLSFFTIEDSIEKPLSKNPSKTLKYSKEKTYVALIIGDGDNIDFVKDARRKWMTDRVSRCTSNQPINTLPCFPLLWSISPRLTYLAPNILKWYHKQMKLTERDYFVLPPSGDLYSYPTMMPSKVQHNFVTNTEKDCNILNTNGVVAWEWNGYWQDAIENYFPQYTSNNTVQALYAENVPYLFPIYSFPRNETYITFNETLFLFKPREWRGPNTTEISNDYYMSSYDMAMEINNYQPGTVTHLYTTSDGGFSIGDIFDMVSYLDDHVKIVDSDQLVDLAHQRNQQLVLNRVVNSDGSNLRETIS